MSAIDLTPEEMEEALIALMNRFHYLPDDSGNTDNPAAKSAFDKLTAVRALAATREPVLDCDVTEDNAYGDIGGACRRPDGHEGAHDPFARSRVVPPERPRCFHRNIVRGVKEAWCEDCDESLPQYV